MSATIWITGDINLPDIDWDLNTIVCHQNPHCLNERFLSFLADCCFTQLVNFPTRLAKTLDIFATNKPALISTCHSIPGISDHDGIYVTASSAIVHHKPCPRKVYIYGRKLIFRPLKMNFIYFLITLLLYMTLTLIPMFSGAPSNKNVWNH